MTKIPSESQSVGRRVDWPFAMILLAGTLIAAHVASSQSITHDEASHVVAGVAYWNHAAYQVYPHNPPLVKLCLAAPVAWSGVSVDQSWLEECDLRPYPMVQHFRQRYEDRLDTLFFRARLVSILFYLAGGWLIGQWSGELFGVVSRRTAAALWCLHPLVLAHATVATPDMGATVLALLALRGFARHLHQATWQSAIVAGVLLGAAQLAKFTLVLLFPVFFTIWLARAGWTTDRPWKVLAGWKLLGVLVAVSVATIPLGYGGRGLGHSCDRLKLYSPTFRVVQQRLDGTSLRFVTGLLPRGYLEGMDQQAVDMDGAWINYFAGRESTAGWLTYYPTALALKTPVAFWCVLILALLAAWRGARAAPEDELCLLLMPVLLGGFLWASPSLTFLRYLLPIYPPLIVSLGRATSLHSSSRRWLQVRIVAVGLTTLAPLLQHPHYLGYFNLVAGGPRACWPVFSDSEVDWGQDLHVLQRWQQSHPEARPMRLALFTPFHPSHPRLVDDFDSLTDDELSSMGPLDVIPVHPEAGYLAISVTLLNRGAALSDQPHDAFATKRPFLRWLKQTHQPLAVVGTSILIFRLTDDDAVNWNRPPSESAWHGPPPTFVFRLLARTL